MPPGRRDQFFGKRTLGYRDKKAFFAVAIGQLHANLAVFKIGRMG
jgi:hypothetical protein